MNARWTVSKVALVAGALSLYLILSVAVARTKMPWSDEGWFACPAYNLAERGMMGSTVVEPTGHYLNADLKGIRERTYYIMPLQPVILAGWFRIFGFGLVSMRVNSIMWGVLLLLSLLVVIRRLSGSHAAAILGMSITAIDFTFIWGSADGRVEIMCAALGYASWAVYLLLRDRNFTAAITVSQIFMAGAFLSHPNAFLEFLGLAFLVFYLDRSRFRLSHVAIGAAPYFIGFGLWSIYILQAPADFITQFSANAAARGVRSRTLLRPWESLLHEVSIRYFAHYGFYPQWIGNISRWTAIVPLIYWGTLIASLRSQRGSANRDRLIAWLTAGCFLTMAFCVTFKAHCYLTHIMPLYGATLGVWVFRKWSEGKRARVAAVAVLTVFVPISLYASWSKIREDFFHKDYLEVIHYLRSPAVSQPVVASAAYGFDFPYDRFVDDLRFGFKSGRQPATIVVDRWYRFMIDGVVRKDEPAVYNYINHLLANDFRLVLETPTARVYQRRSLPQPWQAAELSN